MLTLGLEGFIGNILVRIRPGDIEGTLATLKATWGRVTPEVPFTYTFMDEDLEQQYLSDQRWSKIVSYASFFAILVACLGLFGLASLAVAGRTKEIGIRKVLGASVTSVARLVSREFIWLVGAGLALAAPAAYYAMSRWLEGFAYHIEIGPGIFLLSGAVVLVTAMLAVSYQAVKAAVADPVRSLRYE
jgi:putative ABC transport system permease protein